MGKHSPSSEPQGEPYHFGLQRRPLPDRLKFLAGKLQEAYDSENWLLVHSVMFSMQQESEQPYKLEPGQAYRFNPLRDILTQYANRLMAAFKNDSLGAVAPAIAAGLEHVCAQMSDADNTTYSSPTDWPTEPEPDSGRTTQWITNPKFGQGSLLGNSGPGHIGLVVGTPADQVRAAVDYIGEKYGAKPNPFRTYDTPQRLSVTPSVGPIKDTDMPHQHLSRNPGEDDGSEYWLNIARAVAQGSDCRRRQVGAIVVSDDTIVGSGYNSDPQDTGMCGNGDCPRGLKNYTEQSQGGDYSDCVAVHAEARALLRAGTAHFAAVLYCTEVPCSDCDKLIRASNLAAAVWPGGGMLLSHG